MDKQPDLFDQRISGIRRDIGRSQVVSKSPNKEWLARVVDYVNHLPPGWTGLSEEIRRVYLLKYPDDRPTHPNAWGSVSTLSVKRGLLVRTGNWIKSSSVKSNARLQPEYRKP